MKIRFRMNLKALILVFAILFPILPLYFMVAGVCISNLLCLAVGILGCMILIPKYGISIRRRYVSAVLAVWIALRFLQYEFFSDYIEGIWFLFRTLICGYVVIRGLSDREVFLKVIRGIVYTSGVLAVFGVVESLTQFNIFELLNTSNAVLNYNPLRFGLLRILSFTSQTIVYCIYCMFMASLAFYLLSIEKNIRKRGILRTIYILLWLNGLLTLSRSAIMAFIVCQMILLYGCGYTRFVKRVGMILLLLAAVYGAACLAVPEAAMAGRNLLYMILAVFDGSYADVIKTSFGNDNLTGVGHRTLLYQWVWESIQGHMWFGLGPEAQFEYDYTARYGVYSVPSIKTSIEVQYLYLLYHYGLIGLASEVFAYLAVIWYAVKIRFKPASWEGKLSFSYVCLSVFLVYFIAMFAVNQSSEVRAFYILVFLLLGYGGQRKFDSLECV